MVSCGMCKHWLKRDPYAWGNCTTPVPASALHFLIDSPSALVLQPNDAMAEDCDLYTPQDNHA